MEAAMPRVALLFVSLLGGIGLFSAAASADDASMCADEKTAPQSRINACSRLIASNKLRGERLGEAHFSRARARAKHDDTNRAIRDYTQAIRIHATIGAFLNRGILWGRKGNYDQAIEDFTTAIGMNPNFDMAYTYRGLAYESKGDQDKARADFQATLSLPQGFAGSEWAHQKARERLADLPGAAAAPPVSAPKSETCERYPGLC
jgi:tetratricopeptide (TPR) repeat protein